MAKNHILRGLIMEKVQQEIYIQLIGVLKSYLAMAQGPLLCKLKVELSTIKDELVETFNHYFERMKWQIIFFYTWLNLIQTTNCQTTK
ncbi:hypothetical protein RYX36_010010, partial [Vicia faba]